MPALGHALDPQKLHMCLQLVACQGTCLSSKGAGYAPLCFSTLVPNAQISPPVSPTGCLPEHVPQLKRC
eukprot:1137392-Pelagomonas_calceolata.AAC.5